MKESLTHMCACALWSVRCMRVVLLLETLCVCVVCAIIWKEACSYRNSLLGFWRWANVQPMKTKPSSGRWFNVSSIPVSMQFLKMCCTQVAFGSLYTLSKQALLCVNSCVILWQIGIYTCWHICGEKGGRLLTHKDTLLYGVFIFFLVHFQLNVMSYSWKGALEIKCGNVKASDSQSRIKTKYKSSSNTINWSKMMGVKWRKGDEKYLLLISERICCYVIHPWLI